MANLVFKGHETRGKELYQLLKLLGGIYSGYSQCSFANCYYYINREGYIESSIEIPLYMDKHVIMTLEKFESKYPYKVGDKVRIQDYESEVRINMIRWDGFDIQYGIFTDELEWYSTTELNDFNKPCKEETMEKEISGAIVDRFICLEGYDFYDDKGNIIDTKEITMKKKKPEYPKTYKECCEVLLLNSERATWGIEGLEYKRHLIVCFQRLIICRDAYWKMAGDWKPDFLNPTKEIRYFLFCTGTTIENGQGLFPTNKILIFPTEEMRDAFYENFKKLIEECKELL